MSFRFLLIMSVISLLLSGTAGWIFYGDRAPDPEQLRFNTYKSDLIVAEKGAKSGGVEEWTAYGRKLLAAPERLRDDKAAMALLRKAANRGYAPAQVAIGEMFEYGLGVKRNYHRAVEWYRIASRLSKNPEAHFKVGEAYFRGRGVSQDYGAAVSYYRTAAKQGHPVAQYLIGSMYEAGWGVDQSYIDAWVWYMRARPAAEQIAAHEEGYDIELAIRRAEREMNASQIDTARRLLKQDAS